MTLIVAQAMLLDRQHDQNRPHLRWIPGRLYRSFANANPWLFRR